ARPRSAASTASAANGSTRRRARTPRASGADVFLAGSRVADASASSAPAELSLLSSSCRGLSLVPRARRVEFLEERRGGGSVDQSLHRLSTGFFDDPVVELVGDEREVRERRVDLVRIERLAAEQGVHEDDTRPLQHVAERAEAEPRVQAEQFD